MEITKILNPNIETLELILSQMKEIEEIGLKVKSISLEDIEDPELEWGGSKWTWEIELKGELSIPVIDTLMEILDPDNAGDFSFEQGEETYKFILEVY